MFEYKKYLEYPVRIKNKNPRLANIVMTQYGGPYGKCLNMGGRGLFPKLWDISFFREYNP